MAPKGPSALRQIVMILHWTTVPVIVAWLAEGLPGWAVAAHAVSWIAVTLAWGPRGGMSPALTGWLRRVPRASHSALHFVYGAGAALAMLEAEAARPVLLAVLGLGALHGVFNLWRSSVLGDGCIRRMTPKVLH